MPINWNVRVLRGNPKYQNVYLAYLDVLGFKNLMTRYADGNPQHMVKLFQQIDDAVQHPRISGLVQRYISDSILIWCTHPASLQYMFDVCRELQDELLREGCLIRGAIVSGQHYCGHFDQLNLATGARDEKSAEIMVSPALVKAYTREAVLRDPVIKVEGSVLIALDNLNKKLPRRPRSQLKRWSSTRFYDFPSYLMSLRFSVLRAGAYNSKRPDKKWQTHPDVRKEVAAVQKIRRRILEGLRNKDAKIARKWDYAKRMFNLRVRPMAKKWDLMHDLPIGTAG